MSNFLLILFICKKIWSISENSRLNLFFSESNSWTLSKSKLCVYSWQWNDMTDLSSNFLTDLSCLLYNKSFNLSLGGLMCHEKSLDSRYFNFLLHEYWKIKTHIPGIFFLAHESTRAQIEAFFYKKGDLKYFTMIVSDFFVNWK